MTSLRFSAICAALLCACAGCTTTPTKSATAAEAEQASRRQDLDARLRAAEARVADLRRDAAAASQGQQSVRIGADSKVSVSWNGEAAPLVLQLAKARGWEPKVTGKPILPVPVSIDVRDADLVDVLRDLGAQMGSRADLILRSNQIELRYRTF